MRFLALFKAVFADIRIKILIFKILFYISIIQ